MMDAWGILCSLHASFIHHYILIYWRRGTTEVMRKMFYTKQHTRYGYFVRGKIGHPCMRFISKFLTSRGNAVCMFPRRK